MADTRTIRRLLRWVVLAAVVGVGIVMWPNAVSPFHLPKISWVMVSALLGLPLLAALVADSLSRGEGPGFQLSRVAVATLVAFTAGLLVSMAFATDVPDAIFGEFGRYAGFLPYLSYVFLFLAILHVFSQGCIPWLVRALGIASAAVSLYAILQGLGLDPVTYQTGELPGAFSTMGNPNFASAFVGAVTPVGLWMLLADRGHWRPVGGAHVGLSLLALAMIGSIQGPIVALAGSVTVLAVWGVLRSGRSLPSLRGSTLAGVMGTALIAVVALLAGGAGLLRRGLGSRPLIYEAAWDVFADHPWTGIGFGSFFDFFSRYRSPLHAELYSELSTNTAHSVPMEMLVAGGLLLGIAYAGFVLFVGYTALRNLFDDSYEGDKLLLATLLGVWIGYQLQSLISIDVPALALVHWTASAGILVLTGVESDERSRRALRRRPLAGPAKAVLGLGLVAALVALPQVTRPLRADLAAAKGVEFLNQGRVAEALQSLDRSQQLAPWEPTYVYLEATTLERLGELELAAAAMERAAKLEPGSFQYAVFVARFAEELGHHEDAERWYLEAIGRDPVHVDPLVAAASFFESVGQLDRARDLYREALQLEPGDPTATQGLERLNGNG